MGGEKMKFLLIIGVLALGALVLGAVTAPTAIADPGACGDRGCNTCVLECTAYSYEQCLICCDLSNCNEQAAAMICDHFCEEEI